jgi:hypothetical protein
MLSVKDKPGQVDLEFNSALTRSAELGPWEPFAIVEIYGRADLICEGQSTYTQIRRWCEQVNPQQRDEDVTS